MTFITLLAALVAAHALCDYPLQGDFLAKAKNHLTPIPGVPWYQALGAHAAIQGAAVGLLTGVPALGLAEALAHARIDYLKCDGRIDFNADQSLHIACKFLWAAAVMVIAK